MRSVNTSIVTILKDQKEQLNCKPCKVTILWHQVFYMAFFHVIGLYGIYLSFTSTSWKTMVFAFAYARIVLTGGSAGVHRLWSHRSYKAKLPLQILLCLVSFAYGQNDIFHWSRDHRVHHKYSETDADPHNIKRGFFFAHIGWLLCKKHPAVLEAGKRLPMEDLKNNPVIEFNRKYYHYLWLLFCLIVPTVIPVYCWDENWLNAFCVAGALRYVFQLHCTFYINSFGHTFGYRPFDKNIEARESHLTEAFHPGEGSHNYHHSFPSDYRSKEHGFSFNSSRLFIEFMAFIGQAYDLKLSSDEIVKKRKVRAGKGSS